MNNKEAISEYQKQYRETNKQSINEKKKQWREQNKKCVSEHRKQYYEQNTESIKEKRKSKKYECQCGSNIRKSDKSHHLKTKKHQNFVESL